MKNVWLISFLAMAFTAAAQEKIEPTGQFAIEGEVKGPLRLLQKDLDAFAIHSIDSVVIYNHLMAPKRTMKRVKGVLLRDLLDKAGIDVGTKLLSGVYITCIASDNYKVVFSWNEIYNSAVGDKVLIVTESNGISGNQMNDRIVLLSAADRATGRRYVEGLQKIIVEQVK